MAPSANIAAERSYARWPPRCRGGPVPALFRDVDLDRSGCAARRSFAGHVQRLRNRSETAAGDVGRGVSDRSVLVTKRRRGHHLRSKTDQLNADADPRVEWTPSTEIQRQRVFSQRQTRPGATSRSPMPAAVGLAVPPRRRVVSHTVIAITRRGGSGPCNSDSAASAVTGSITLPEDAGDNHRAGHFCRG